MRPVGSGVEGAFGEADLELRSWRRIGGTAENGAVWERDDGEATVQYLQRVKGVEPGGEEGRAGLELLELPADGGVEASVGAGGAEGGGLEAHAEVKTT